MNKRRKLNELDKNTIQFNDLPLEILIRIAKNIPNKELVYIIRKIPELFCRFCFYAFSDNIKDLTFTPSKFENKWCVRPLDFNILIPNYPIVITELNDTIKKISFTETSSISFKDQIRIIVANRQYFTYISHRFPISSRILSSTVSKDKRKNTFVIIPARLGQNRFDTKLPFIFPDNHFFKSIKDLQLSIDPFSFMNEQEVYRRVLTKFEELNKLKNDGHILEDVKRLSLLIQKVPFSFNLSSFINFEQSSMDYLYLNIYSQSINEEITSRQIELFKNINNYSPTLNNYSNIKFGNNLVKLELKTTGGIIIENWNLPNLKSLSIKCLSLDQFQIEDEDEEEGQLISFESIVCRKLENFHLYIDGGMELGNTENSFQFGESIDSLRLDMLLPKEECFECFEFFNSLLKFNPKKLYLNHDIPFYKQTGEPIVLSRLKDLEITKIIPNALHSLHMLEMPNLERFKLIIDKNCKSSPNFTNDYNNLRFKAFSSLKDIYMDGVAFTDYDRYLKESTSNLRTIILEGNYNCFDNLESLTINNFNLNLYNKFEFPKNLKNLHLKAVYETNGQNDDHNIMNSELFKNGLLFNELKKLELENIDIDVSNYHFPKLQILGLTDVYKPKDYNESKDSKYPITSLENLSLIGGSFVDARMFDFTRIEYFYSEALVNEELYEKIIPLMNPKILRSLRVINKNVDPFEDIKIQKFLKNSFDNLRELDFSFEEPANNIFTIIFTKDKFPKLEKLYLMNMSIKTIEMDLPSCKSIQFNDITELEVSNQIYKTPNLEYFGIHDSVTYLSKFMNNNLPKLSSILFMSAYELDESHELNLKNLKTDYVKDLRIDYFYPLREGYESDEPIKVILPKGLFGSGSYTWLGKACKFTYE